MENQNPDTKTTKKQVTVLKTLSFAAQFAFIILIPLVILAFVGKWLSTQFNNPLYLYGGLLLALIISTFWFYKKISDLYKDFID